MRKRAYSKARRQLEFNVVLYQVKRRKAAFIARLERHITPIEDCLCWTAMKHRDGYGKMNFRYDGQHLQITVPRVFLILQLGKPIPKGYEAGHTPQCPRRSCIKHIEAQHFEVNLAQRKRSVLSTQVLY